MAANASDTVYAWTNFAGYGGRSADGAGSAARFYNPNGVAVDSAGNLFVADAANYTIRKVTAAGVVTTLAGKAGNFGSVDGTGSAARFGYPAAVAVDNVGNVYVGDGNNTIRKVTAAGVVTTLAGSAGSDGSADGTGSAARFYGPAGVAVDSAGNVFVADCGNNTIRKVTAAGVVTTLAGSAGVQGSADGTGSAARFSGPSGVAVDGAGNVFVADCGNSLIRMVTAAGVVTTLAGGGVGSGFGSSYDATGSEARFNGPSGVAVDSAGNLFVADRGNNTIRKVTAAGVVTTLVGEPNAQMWESRSADGAGSAARFYGPSGVAVDSAGNLFVADSQNNTIRKVTAAGVVTTLAGSAEVFGSADGTGNAARFYSPTGVAVDGLGNVFVADSNNYTIRKVTAAGVVTTLAGSAGASGSADGTGSAARFSGPNGVAVDSAGNVFVADVYTIRKVTAAGVVTTLAGSAEVSGSADGTGSEARVNCPAGVAVDGAGNVFVADSRNNTIRKVTAAGVVTTLAGLAGVAGSADGTGNAARFYYPRGVAVDNIGNLYVADGVVRKVTAAGVVTTLGGTSQLNANAVAVDSMGNVFVVDYSNFLILKVTAAGVVTTLGGSLGYSGSTDGTGSEARFYYPYGVAVDSAGNLFVADSGNSRISKGTPTGSLQVTLVPSAAVNAGAQWRVDGDAWQDSGAIITALPAGSHTLEYSTVIGWATPASQNVAINTDATSTVNGFYLPLPRLVVEQPAGTSLASGSGQNFGTLLVGATRFRSFLIRNTGGSILTGLSLSISGSGASHYAVSASPAAAVLPGDSTSFTLAYTPGSTGLKTATLHIASNTDPFDISLTGVGGTSLSAGYTTGTEIPAVANGFTATGKTVNFSLNYAPATGTNLMVVNNTGIGFINGTFNGLAQGQVVALPFNGATYHFIANYYGGSGNDLVLQWAGTRLLAWGANLAGTLGNGTKNGSLAPVPVTMSGVLANKTILAVAAAEKHSLALCSDGTLAAWGANGSGQLGTGTTAESLVPVQVNALQGSALYNKAVVAVAAGCDFSVALCSDGSVAAWGLNGSGQLGDTTWSNHSLPVAVNATGGSALAGTGKAVVAVAAGNDFCLAVCADGSVAAWGADSCGQLGNNSPTDSPLPVALNMSGVLSGKTVAAVAAGHYHSLALCTDGTLAAWGDNSFGELGNNSTDPSLVPVLVSNTGALSGKTPASIGAGQFHSIALCADGTLVTWGDNSYGQLGLSGPDHSGVPVTITASSALSGKTVTSIAAGQSHNAALLADGTLAAWGGNDSGQLGNGTTDNSSLPVAVNTASLAAGERIVKLAGGPTASHGIGVVAVPLASLAGPAVTTSPATGMTKTAATVQGLANPNGLATTAYFEYGLTTGYGNQTSAQSIGNGTTTANVQAVVSGLQPNTVYHFRIKATNNSGTAVGDDVVFTTQADPPLAVTEPAISLTGTGATLAGVVNPNGRITQVRFEYGLTTNFGNTITVLDLPAGSSNVETSAPITGLSAGSTYYYRIVATNAGGTGYGDAVSFVTVPTGGTPTASPAVTTGGTTEIATTGATLLGIVNPYGGMTNAYFEYGTTSGYGSTSSNLGAGFGSTPVNLSAATGVLQPGTLYHYRMVAENSLGRNYGTDATFTTRFLPPAVTTGGSAPVSGSTTSVQVNGTARAHNASTQVYFDYATDGVNFISVGASPATVTGDADTAASAILPNLLQGITYSYRVRAVSVGGTTTGDTMTFQVAVLSGLTQLFPAAPPTAPGSVTVTLTPIGIASGWRFVGEQQWRNSASTAAALTTGDRDIEFRPVPGYIQPPRETVTITSGTPVPALTRDYYETNTSGSGGLSVTLKPDSIAAGTVAAAQRAQWRLPGEDDTKWRDSGTTLNGLIPGNYLLECKPVTGCTTPTSASVLVQDGQTAAPTITYFLADSLTGTQPVMVPFGTVSTDQSKPYAYVGQIRSDVGSSSGFVVKARVVATAGHVVFDDGTLSATTGLQWLFQRDIVTYEPTPQIPRGFYIFDGYAAQRRVESTPGSSLPQSQNLDAAALYFNETAGRGGYSGFLASDLDNNQFILSSAQKTLVGYPVDGISPSDQGRMHATPSANVTFNPVLGYHRVFTTTDIRSSGGGSGGPLCVQYPFQGNSWYYPAAIYLGGSGQTVVRAIDSQVIDLFNRAEVSGNGGDNNTGGGITHTSVTGNLNPVKPGSLMVLIQPAGAVDAGAGWRLKPESSYRLSGAQKSGLSSGNYVLQFPTISGFPAPAQQPVTLTGGQLMTLTFTYGQTLTPIESWRLAKFGTTANTGNAADNADPDHDGQTNLSEYTAGTDPNNPTDVFKVLTTQKTGTSFTLTAAGKAGRSYTLQRNTDLANGIWTPQGSLGPLAADGPVVLTDSSAPAGRAFYRIQVAAP